MREFSIVMTTCGDADRARPITCALLEEGLAACVQVMPIQSHYIWEGAVQHEHEVLLLIKCRAENYKAIENVILRLHDYEVPEIVQIPITDGSRKYLDWVAEPK